MKIRIFSIVMVVLVFFARPAYAYLDAGSASMIIQMILAGIVGALVSVKFYWQKICKFTRKLFSSANNKND